MKVKPHSPFAAISASVHHSDASGFTAAFGGSIISRPTIRPVSLKQAHKFSGVGFIAQEKMDGVFSFLEWQKCVLAGERMMDGSFYAFDILKIQCDDCRRSRYGDRWQALIDLAPHFTDKIRLVKSGVGGEFLDAVLANGGEGVVFKNVEGYWGVGQWKAKRTETFDVRVVEKLRNAVAIEFEDGNAGRVPIYGRAFEIVSVGDVVEISAYCRTVSGKFREPRFIRIRQDKN